MASWFRISQRMEVQIPRFARDDNKMTGRFGKLMAIAWRESRTARRRLLLYMSSISLGVAALVAIDSFTANVSESVREQSKALLGGDVVLRARSPYSASTRSLDRKSVV